MAVEFFGLSTTPITPTKFSVFIGIKGISELAALSAGRRRVTVKVASSSPRFAFTESKDPKNHIEYGDYGGFRVTVETGIHGNTFEITVLQDGQKRARGKFKTFPHPDDHSSFTFAFTSCTDPDKEEDHDQLKRQNQGFKRMVEQMDSNVPISFCLHLGDNFYSHTSRIGPYEKDMWGKVYRMRSKGWIGKAYARIPFIHTWDNHDHVDGAPFGKDHPGKTRKRRKVFSKIFKVPSKGSNPAGIFHKFSIGGCGFYMMDSRTHRAKDRSQMWGKGQWEWLENSISGSDHHLHFICTSSPIVAHSPRKANGHTRRMQYYEGDYNRMHRLLNKYKNVVIITGDVHRCKYRLRTFSRLENGQIVHEGSESIEATQSLELYSSGIGRFKKRKGHPTDNWWEQSYLTVTVEPIERKLIIRRVPRSKFKLTRGYVGERRYPKEVIIDPSRPANSYVVEVR